MRDGATGSNDGSDWVNAYDSFPETLERGAFYYIADGVWVIGAYEFDPSIGIISQVEQVDHFII